MKATWTFSLALNEILFKDVIRTVTATTFWKKNVVTSITSIYLPHKLYEPNSNAICIIKRGHVNRIDQLSLVFGVGVGELEMTCRCTKIFIVSTGSSCVTPLKPHLAGRVWEGRSGGWPIRLPLISPGGLFV